MDELDNSDQEKVEIFTREFLIALINFRPKSLYAYLVIAKRFAELIDAEIKMQIYKRELSGKYISDKRGELEDLRTMKEQLAGILKATERKHEDKNLF